MLFILHIRLFVFESSPHFVFPGFFAIVLSCVAVAAAVYQGVDLTYIHSHFLQLATATFLISILLSVYLYVRSRYAAPEKLALGGNSGKETDLVTFGCFFCWFVCPD